MASIYEMLGLGQGAQQPPATTPVTATQFGGVFSIPSPYQQQGTMTIPPPRQGSYWEQKQLEFQAQQRRDAVMRQELMRQMQNHTFPAPGALQPLAPAKEPKMTFVWGVFDD